MNILQFLVPKSLVEYLEADSTVRQATEKMRFHRYAAMPVIDGEGRYVGTLHNDDLFRFYFETGSFDLHEAENTCVTDIMNRKSGASLSHSADVKELIECVKEHNFVSITDDRNVFIGLILRREVLNYLLQYYKED